MADDDPNLDLPDLEEKEGFPWILLLVIVLVIALAGMWIMHGKYHGGHDTSVAALETQLTTEKVVLETERNKVFDMTNQLDAMKQALKLGQVQDRQKLAAEYNKLAAEQNAQRNKVKTLADQYNEKVAKLHELQ